MAVVVREAGAGDLGVLVALRVANAEAHVALDPGTYRSPPVDAVERYFRDVLAGAPAGDGVLVAETGDGRVVGMIEILRHADAPAHQILRPEPSAQVHTVVLGVHRGLGVGAALLRAAERWAAERGIRYLSAGIHHRNDAAVRFYRRHGYLDVGVALGKSVPAER